MQPVDSIMQQLFADQHGEQRALIEQIKPVEIPAGHTVFRRGDVCQNYLVVVTGSVKVQVLSQGGREVLLYRVTDGQSCVITTSCLISQEAYPAEGVTETEVTALVIPGNVFDACLAHSAGFRAFVFSNQGRRLSSLILRLEDIAFGRLDERLARLLYERSDKGCLPIAATHQVLASELGTAREVVTRQLKVFEQKGLIRTARGSVTVLDPNAFAAMLS